MGVQARTGQDSPLGQGGKGSKEVKGRGREKSPRSGHLRTNVSLWKIHGQPPNLQSKERRCIVELSFPPFSLCFFTLSCRDFSGKQLSVIMSAAALPLLLQQEEPDKLSWQLSLHLSLCSLWLHISIYMAKKILYFTFFPRILCSIFASLGLSLPLPSVALLLSWLADCSSTAAWLTYAPVIN